MLPLPPTATTTTVLRATPAPYAASSGKRPASKGNTPNNELARSKIVTNMMPKNGSSRCGAFSPAAPENGNAAAICFGWPRLLSVASVHYPSPRVFVSRSFPLFDSVMTFN